MLLMGGVGVVGGGWMWNGVRVLLIVGVGEGWVGMGGCQGIAGCWVLGRDWESSADMMAYV